MIRFLKGALKGYDPNINDWDKPNIRYFDGKKVVGSPTKGFGDPGSEFYYAGKLYKPEMWTPEMETIKKQTELLVYEKLGKIVRFTFCLFLFILVTLRTYVSEYVDQNFKFFDRIKLKR